MAHIDIGQDSLLTLYKNVEVTAGLELVFTNAAAREAYFNRRILKHYTDMSYVYRNGVIKIQETPQVVAQSNFISFTNPSFENKVIYARIVDYTYVNNATVEITYTVDYWLTFMFDVSFRSCQIMREHLSETDWQKAVADPWRHDILELETSESFNFTPDDYKLVDVNSNDFVKFAGKDSKTLYAMVLTGYVKGVKDGETGKPAAGFAHLYSWTKSFTSLPDDISAITNFHGYKIGGGRLPRIPNACVAWLTDFRNAATLLDWEGRDKNKMSFVQYGLDSLVESSQSSSVIGVYLVTDEFIRSVLQVMSFGLNASGKVTSGDPKLSRFPFSYFRVTTPDTGEKEYHIEKFKNPRDMGFSLLSTINTNCSSYLIPTDYDYYGSDGRVFNPMERMEYRNVPQLSYNVDGFLTYMSNVYADARAWAGTIESGTRNKHASLIEQLPQRLPMMMSASNFGGAATMAATGNFAGAAASVASGAGSIMKHDMQARNAAAYSGVEGSKPYYDYSAERARYVSSTYTPGSFGAGLLSVLDRDSFEGFFMTLNEGNQAKANNYFSMFGYNSGRIGVPRVCNLVTGDGPTPHFVTWDGDPCTYVQTADMRVISTMKPISDYIEQVFNSGHRFIKGDGR